MDGPTAPTTPPQLFGQNTIGDPITFNAPNIVAPPRQLRIVPGTAMQFPNYNLGYDANNPPAFVRKWIDTVPPNVRQSWKFTTPHRYENVSLQNPHPLLFQFAPYETTLQSVAVPLLADETGSLVCKNGVQLRYFSFLPDHLSQQYDPVHVELWRRMDPRLENADLVSRMEKRVGEKNPLPEGNSINTRVGRARTALKTPSWVLARKNPTANELRLLLQLSAESVAVYNTTMEIHNGRLLTPRKAARGVTEYIDSGLSLDYFTRNGPRSIPERHLKVSAALLRRLQTLAFHKGKGTAPDNWESLPLEDCPSEFHDRHQELKEVRARNQRQRQRAGSSASGTAPSYGKALKNGKRAITELDDLTHDEWLAKVKEVFPEDLQKQWIRTKTMVGVLQLLLEKDKKIASSKRKRPTAAAQESGNDGNNSSDDDAEALQEKDEEEFVLKRQRTTRRPSSRRMNKKRKADSEHAAQGAEAEERLGEESEKPTRGSKRRQQTKAPARRRPRHSIVEMQHDPELDNSGYVPAQLAPYAAPSTSQSSAYTALVNNDIGGYQPTHYADIDPLAQQAYRATHTSSQQLVDDASRAAIASDMNPWARATAADLEFPVAPAQTLMQPPARLTGEQESYPDFHADMSRSTPLEVGEWDRYYTGMAPIQEGVGMTSDNFSTALLQASTDANLGPADMQQQLNAYAATDLTYGKMPATVGTYDASRDPDYAPWYPAAATGYEPASGESTVAEAIDPALLDVEYDESNDPLLIQFLQNLERDIGRASEE